MHRNFLAPLNRIKKFHEIDRSKLMLKVLTRVRIFRTFEKNMSDLCKSGPHPTVKRNYEQACELCSDFCVI